MRRRLRLSLGTIQYGIAGFVLDDNDSMTEAGRLVGKTLRRSLFMCCQEQELVGHIPSASSGLLLRQPLPAELVEDRMDEFALGLRLIWCRH
jgi:hypothetical protein